MKNRILTFIIGMLVGAILSTAGFLVYSKSINVNQMMRPMEEGGQIQRPGGNMQNPPVKPDENFQQKMQNNF